MPIPAIYTVPTLEAFMLDELKEVGVILGIILDDLREAVDDVVILCGQTLIANCTDIIMVRKIAKVEAWRHAAKCVSLDYDFSEGGATYNRSQMQEMIFKQLDRVQLEAAEYYSNWTIGTAKMDYTENPYDRLNECDL